MLVNPESHHGKHYQPESNPDITGTNTRPDTFERIGKELPLSRADTINFRERFISEKLIDELMESGANDIDIDIERGWRMSEYIHEQNMRVDKAIDLTSERAEELHELDKYSYEILSLSNEEFARKLDELFPDQVSDAGTETHEDTTDNDDDNQSDERSLHDAYVDFKVVLPWEQSQDSDSSGSSAPTSIPRSIRENDAYVDVNIDLPWERSSSADGDNAAPPSLDTDAVVPSRSETVYTTERIELLEKERQQSATKMAILGARRQLNPFTRRKVKEEYLTAESEYTKADVQLSELEFTKYLEENQDATDDEIKAKLVEFNINQEKSLYEKTKTAIDSRFSSRVVNYLNTGSEKKKFAKMAVVGALGSVAIAGVAAATMLTAGGALGGLVAGVAAGGAAGGRFGVAGFKSFVRKEGSQGRGAKLDEASLVEKSASSIEVMGMDQLRLDPSIALRRIAKQRRLDREARLGSEQKKRRKALTAAAIGASVGAVVGTTIGTYAGDAVDYVSDRFSDGGAGSSVVNAPSAPDAPSPVVPEVPEIALPDPDVVPDYGFDISQFADAQNVSAGEGWYQTFGELGVSNSYDQAKLLNDDVLMSKLANMGVAYTDANAGGWGINMPANGKMPTEALELIRQTAAQNNLAISR